MSAGVQADMHTAAMLTSVLPPPLHSQVLLLSMRLTRKYWEPLPPLRSAHSCDQYALASEP